MIDLSETIPTVPATTSNSFWLLRYSDSKFWDNLKLRRVLEHHDAKGFANPNFAKKFI